MTPEQQQRILDVIAQDANGRCSLYRSAKHSASGEPEYCVLGGLALVAGWDNDTIIVTTVSVLCQLLLDTYGLTHLQAASLVSLNDRYTDVVGRRAALSEMVRAYKTHDPSPAGEGANRTGRVA